MTAITGSVENLLKHEPMWAVPVVKSITVSKTAASVIEGKHVVLNCDGHRIQYRITMRIPDDDGNLTLYLALDRILEPFISGDYIEALKRANDEV